MPVDDATFTIPEPLDRRPLDAALKALCAGLSWGDARKLITSGKIKLRGAVVLVPTKFVHAGDTLEITMRAPRPATSQRLGGEVILFEDDLVVVVNKPAGVSTVPFEPEDKGTLDQLVRALLSRSRRARGGPVQGTLGVVHRLDKDTTGVLVFARTLEAKRNLAQQFRDHTVHRRYLALANGHVDSATIRTRLVADRGDGFRGSTRDSNQGQLAITHVEALERLDHATLIRCQLETGRTHQIRIHLAESGHPLVGERVYVRRGPGAPPMASSSLPVDVPRIMLHAAELGFIHPQTGRELRFEQPLPDDFATVLEALGGHTPTSTQEALVPDVHTSSQSSRGSSDRSASRPAPRPSPRETKCVQDRPQAPSTPRTSPADDAQPVARREHRGVTSRPASSGGAPKTAGSGRTPTRPARRDRRS